MTVKEGETREGITVAKLGHWHPDAIFLRVKHRDVRVWEVDFEQKRPAVGWTQSSLGHGEHGVGVESREEGSMFFREGEDGSQATLLTFNLPGRYRLRRYGWRFRLWRRSWIISVSEDKWSIFITAALV